MALVVPCLKGKMGSTEYYEAMMPARELVHGARPASESDEWASLSIEDRMQRDPNLKRIREEIAPYIANSADRFFGAIIVLVADGDIAFESLKDLNHKMPNAYRSSADRLGFITVDGGSLIVLDGQHRLLALEAVIKNEVKGSFSSEVPNDDVTVIFIKHESSQKTRRIFNKVNRYAKPTSRGDNIITSEDDGFAIISRRLLGDGGPFAVKIEGGDELIVNWKSNTLSSRSKQLTTISVVYDTVKTILSAKGVLHLDKATNRPSDEDLEQYYDQVEGFWSTVLANLKPYVDGLENPHLIPKMRDPDSEHSLLFKPVAQIALVQGLIRSTVDDRLTLKEAVSRANRIDWRMTSNLWRDIIVRAAGTIDTTVDAREVASQLISYLIAGEKMSVDEIRAVEEACRKAKGKSDESDPDWKLPDPVSAPSLREAPEAVSA